METFENRLARFLDNGPVEIVTTICFSIVNTLIPELKALTAGQPYLIVLGTHAVMQTVSHKVLGVAEPRDRTEHYLRNFVDGAPSEGLDFSAISGDLHEWRNVVGHQWISASGHDRKLDDTFHLGWERAGKLLTINHIKYRDAFVTQSSERLTWQKIASLLTHDQLVNQKYKCLASYLHLPPKDPIADQISALVTKNNAGKRAALEAAIRASIRAKYSL